MPRSSTYKRCCTSRFEPSIKGCVASHKRQKLRTSSSEFCNEPNAKPSYFSLPAEIRNQITSLALTGGHIYMEGKSQRTLRSHDRKPLNGPSAPAANFLATCRQAYEEGHVMFYTQNTFHLPPGSLGETKEVLAEIKPEHIAMMRSVTLGLTLLDLTPTVARMVEADVAANLRARLRTRKAFRNEQRDVPSSTVRLREPWWEPDSAHAYKVSLHLALRTCWEKKLHFARSAFPGVDELRVGINVIFGILILQGRNANGLIGYDSGCLICRFSPSTSHKYDHRLGDPSPEECYQLYIDCLLQEAAFGLTRFAESKISGMGWREFKKPASLESIETIKEHEADKVELDILEQNMRDWGMQQMSEEEHGGL